MDTMLKWPVVLTLACVIGFAIEGRTEERLVTGKVYSYLLNGMRRYSAKPPPKGAVSPRTINYSYIESTADDPAAQPLYRCRQPNGTPNYTRQAGVGCVVVGMYRSAPVAPLEPIHYFGGYPCTIDCSGHEAGYAWAEQKGIDDPDNCGGRSQSFIEGCMAYAEEIHQEMIEDGECEDSDEDGICDD